MNGLKLENDVSDRPIAAGEVIFNEGEPSDYLYIIKSGKVRLLKEIGARQVTQLLRCEGEFLGEVPVLSGEPYQFTAVVEEDAQIIKIDTQDIQDVLKLCPEWIPNIMLTLSERLTALRELMRDHRMNDPSLERAGIDPQEATSVINTTTSKKV